MIREELIKTFKSSRSKFLFIYLLAVAIGDNICGILQTGELGGYPNAHPAFISLLSGQSAIVFYALFVWILPITLILLYCSRYNQERKSNMDYIYLTKVGRKSYFCSKMISSFILPVIYCGIPLLLNLFIYMLFLNGGTSFCDLESMSADDLGSYLYYCVNHPYIAWFGYFFAALIMFGLAGILSQSIAIIAKDNRITLAFSFALWIAFFSFKYDITMIIQPYTEYGIDYALKTLVLFIPIVIVSIISAYISAVVKKDEI